MVRIHPSTQGEHMKETKNKEVDENIYDIKFYPLHLRPIIRILMKFENSLSDGFEWYGSVDILTKLAQTLYDLNLKKKE